MRPSLRTHLERLEAIGELCRIAQPVERDLVIAEIADRTMKLGGPALLFEHVEGSEFPLAINVFGSVRRMALALGVEDLQEHARAIEKLVKQQPPRGLWDKIRAVTELAELRKIFPRQRNGRGECQEVVMDPPDLARLPIMKCWPYDGGRFICLPLVFTRDPETGIRNVGMYRMQVIDGQTTGMHWQAHKTGQRHYRAAKQRGDIVPVAVALGGDPIYTYCATAPLPPNVDELLLAGFLRKQPVELVRCLTNDLEVPADADFVIEGYVDPREPLFKEGPFGDHTGYYSLEEDYPRFHVTAITHRHDAVYPSTIVGPPPMEDAYLGKATERIFLPLLRLVFPEIIDMNLPVEGVFHNMAILAIKKDYPHHARKIMSSLWGMGQIMFTKVIVVCDEDVDVQDLGEVSWRVLNNIDPQRDIMFTEGPIDVLDHASRMLGFGSKMGVDATRKWPEEGFTRRWPELVRMDDATRDKVDTMWGRLGIERYLSPGHRHRAGWGGPDTDVLGRTRIPASGIPDRAAHPDNEPAHGNDRGHR